MLTENQIKAIKILTDYLIKNNIICALFAGAAATVYGSERKVTDIDFITSNENYKKIIKDLKNYLISICKKSEIIDTPKAKFNIENSVIEITPDIKIHLDKNYKFYFDDEMISKLKEVKLNETKIKVLSPEDSIVFKSILQRGEEQGKFDIQDVEAILKNQEIDWNYLKHRAIKCDAYGRVKQLMNKLGYGDNL